MTLILEYFAKPWGTAVYFSSVINVILLEMSVLNVYAY